MAAHATEPDVEATPDSNTVVALYDFDPSTVDWPFRRQRPLPLQTGRMITVVHDDGSEWALGNPVGQPELRGYFPKNYTVSVAEYNEMIKDYEQAETDGRQPQEVEPVLDDEQLKGPPETQALPTMLPETETLMPMMPEEFDDLPEIQIPGVAGYPVLEPMPPIPTTFEVNKARLLREPPAVPRLRPIEPAPPSDPIDRAMLEVQRELEEQQEDVRLMPGGKITDSRASTPATLTLTRPEKDFVKRHLPAAMRDQKLERLSTVKDVIMRKIRQARESKPPFGMDLRVRSTTCRVAGDIQPGIMQMALNEATALQTKWKQMFRPGFNDIVNEAYKVGCNACILSNFYIQDQKIQETFQKLHVNDVGGTLWFELRRNKKHLFYMRMEGFDVMMCHPDAWGFPDATHYVRAGKGEACNPMHGWLFQGSIDTDREMEDVEFLYTMRLRSFPESAFNNLALGKVPKWIEPYSTLQGEASLEDEKPVEEGGAGGGKGLASDKALLAEAGMQDGDDVYVQLDELRLARERTVGPDILDARHEAFRLKGLSAIRIFYRSKGKPDNMKQTLLTPKIVKDMAAMLGIKGDCRTYWYCLFALRYPLAPEWEVIVKNDTRWYLHLPTDRIQPIHPLIKAFRTHRSDFVQNEFLWDFRGFVRMKCAQCGIPDSVLWCMQCTDYFCVKCFLVVHKSERGKKHWSMPVPGCRYLDRKEVERVEPYLPPLNIGFSNRRRFLARDNQSDKMGTKEGDPWLYFHCDSFHAGLVQCPKDHWYVKRSNPPRLAPGQTGYWYNFDKDILADDPEHINTATHEQKALSLLQKAFRGALTRRRILRETEAAVVIQKTKMMWDVQKVYGSTGKNANVIKSWYRKFAARADRNKMECQVASVQGVWRGISTRRFYSKKIYVLSKFQAAFRGRRSRRMLYVDGPGIKILSVHSRRTHQFQPGMKHMATVQLHARNNSGRKHAAAATIQSYYRGYLHGRHLMALRHDSAARIQATYKAVAYRESFKRQVEAATRLEGRSRGILARKRVGRMHGAALKIQCNWRRFTSQIHVKQMLFSRMYDMTKKRKDMLLHKMKVAAVEIMQRQFRRYRDYQTYLYLRKEKGDADKRTQTLIVAMFSAAGALRHHVHPWWRHLPPEIQEVLEQIKNPMQRTISNVRIDGKMANEEIGRRGLRVAQADHLVYKQGKDPDLASHMFLSITRHLLSLVPAELFPATVKWACYTISHKAVDLSKKGVLEQHIINVGKDMPPHPGDTLATLAAETGSIRSGIESFIKVPDVSLPITVLHALSPHHRQVFLTAQVLITMRQALAAPSLSTEDHLKFQGLDISAGAQLMEVLGSELDHAVPLDWPKQYATVAALAAEAATHVAELQPARAKGHGNPKLLKASKGKDLADAVKGAKDTAKDAKKEDPKEASKGPKKTGESSPKAPTDKEHKTDDHKAKVKPKPKAKGLRRKKKSQPEHDELGHLAHFNRNALFRVVQQIGYLMRDQDGIVNTVLANEEGLSGDNRGQQGVRTSRYITVTEKLFDMADGAKHDHCSFVLAVVLFHLVMRGLMLRVIYHRAAVAMQKRYRYLRNRGDKFSQLPHAITIQRYWRGLQTALRSMRMINAGKVIARNRKVILWKRRAAKFLHSILTIQRYWRGSLSRRWMENCQHAATFIQKSVRRLLVRVVLDKPGRDIVRKYQKEMNIILHGKDSRPESEHIARCCVLAGKTQVAMEKQRNRNVDMRRALSFNLRSKHTRTSDRAKMMEKVGRTQPQRHSVFEPLVFAIARLEPSRLPHRYGCQQSRVLKLIQNSKTLLNATLPPEEGAVVENKSWICFRWRKNAEGETEVCREANQMGMTFCKGCGQKQYGRQHAASVRGQAAIVAMRLAKTAKKGHSKAASQHSKQCAAWGKAMFQVEAR